MKPYYEQEGIVIYHGDCREILPALEAGMVIITDQPYGAGWARGGGAVGEFNAKHEQPEWDRFDLSWVRLLRNPRRIAAFAPIGRTEELCNTLPEPAVLHYIKTNVRPNGVNRESIVCSPPPHRGPWKFSAYNGDAPFHPCQKPEEVMDWLVRVVVGHPADVILDPFMGSGTTLVAAKKAGHSAVGVELDERYCEIASKRLSQCVLPFASAV